MSKLILLTLVMLGCQGCPPSTPPVPPDVPDGGSVVDAPEGDVLECDSTPVVCACQNLCRFECEECTPECADTIDHILTARLTYVDVDCIRGATSKAEIQQCAGAVCP